MTIDRPRIVVTGGAGFLGNAFVVALRRRFPGAEILPIDVRRGPGVRIADILDRAALDPLVAGADLVVHTAAVVEESGPVEVMWRVNVDGTRSVLAAAEAAGGSSGSGPAVLHLSSIVVHGPSFPDGVDETGPVRMSGNPYTDTKVAAEHQALLAAARGLPVTVVRPGDVYGPGSSPWTMRPVATMQSGSFRLIDRGRGILSPVFVDDLVEGTLSLLDPDGGPRLRAAAVGEVFHVHGGTGVPAADFFAHYARMLDVRLKSVPASLLRGLAPLLERLPLPFSPRIVEYLSHPGTYSIAKIARTTGWRPRVDLAEGMASTERWLRERALIPR